MARPRVDPKLAKTIRLSVKYGADPADLAHALGLSVRTIRRAVAGELERREPALVPADADLRRRAARAVRELAPHPGAFQCFVLALYEFELERVSLELAELRAAERARPRTQPHLYLVR